MWASLKIYGGLSLVCMLAVIAAGLWRFPQVQTGLSLLARDILH